MVCIVDNIVVSGVTQFLDKSHMPSKSKETRVSLDLKKCHYTSSTPSLIKYRIAHLLSATHCTLNVENHDPLSVFTVGRLVFTHHHILFPPCRNLWLTTAKDDVITMGSLLPSSERGSRPSDTNSCPSRLSDANSCTRQPG